MPLFSGEKRALNEIASVLAAQWSNGMLPHIRYVPGQTGYSPDAGEWGISRKISGNQNFDTSGITQPPNIALALWQVYQNSKNRQLMIPFLEKFYPALRKFHEFLLTERDPEGEGLATVFHPWATGSDNTPCYDDSIMHAREWLIANGFEQRITKRKDAVYVAAGQRPKQKDYEAYGRLLGFFLSKEYDQKKIYTECPFLVQDVLFNAIIKESLQSMAKICEVLGSYYAGNREKASFYSKDFVRNKMLASKVMKAIRNKLYDRGTGLFYSFDVRAGQLIKVSTVHSLVPLFGKCASEDQAKELINHIKNEDEFSPREGFMLPSVPLNSTHFDGQGYARGPIWPVRNWLVAKGLENYDKGLAKKVRNQTLELISQGHKDLEKLREMAESLMMFNSFKEEFTVPSKKQYSHGWLWDSGFAAIAWSHIGKKPSPEIWEKIDAKKKEMVQEGKCVAEAKDLIRKEFDMPLFDEYFTPVQTNGQKPGFPLGSDAMTWTAAFFLDLLNPKAAK